MNSTLISNKIKKMWNKKLKKTTTTTFSQFMFNGEKMLTKLIFYFFCQYCKKTNKLISKQIANNVNSTVH